jgi:hypothetical protein
MSVKKRFFCRLSLSVAVFCVVLISSVVIYGQTASTQPVGVPEDWTHHHLIFSTPHPPGFEQALKQGTLEKWLRLQNEPRLRLQQLKRNSVATAPDATEISPDTKEILAPVKRPPAPPPPPPPPPPKRPSNKKAPMDRDWSVSLNGAGVAAAQYPAKYTFGYTGAPNCTSDFAVFPVNAPGVSGSQANIVGINNLYSANPTCNSGVPTVEFAYYIGTGTVQTSPVLSLDGTKMAYVESATGASRLHVTTIGSGTGRGTAANSPAIPGSGNNAADIATMIGAGVSVTRSSVYYDYGTDNAYVGDDSGYLHKFTGVFFGTPTEVTTSPWPITIAASTILSSPLYDPVSQNIYIGSSNGNLYRVVASSGAVTSVAVGAGGTYGGIVDAPVVDSSTGYVFAAAGELASTYSCANSGGGVVQTTTTLASPVYECLGIGNVNNAHSGAFDNAYFNSVSTGHMYWVGNDATYGVPALWYLGFNSSGLVTSATEAKDTSSSPATPLILASVAEDASPVTEIYNTYSSTDWLFVTVPGSSCGGATSGGCIMSFNIGTPPTIGPWLPNWSHYTTNSKVVDTNGNIQAVGFPGAKATGTLIFYGQPEDWLYFWYYNGQCGGPTCEDTLSITGEPENTEGSYPIIFASSADPFGYDTFYDEYCPVGYLGAFFLTCDQVLIGGSVSQTAQNLAAAINQNGACGDTDPNIGTCYDLSASYGDPANPYMSATPSGNDVILTATSVGTWANTGYCWSWNYSSVNTNQGCLSGGVNTGPPETTGTTEPTWSTTSGGTITDNTLVTWTNGGASSNGQTSAVQATGTSGIVIDNVFNPAWQASHAYQIGNLIIGITGGYGYVFECTTGGTSGSSTPTWCATAGCTVTETTGVKWTNQGANPTANLYLGTLGGAKSAVKYTQAGFQ